MNTAQVLVGLAAVLVLGCGSQDPAVDGTSTSQEEGGGGATSSATTSSTSSTEIAGGSDTGEENTISIVHFPPPTEATGCQIVSSTELGPARTQPHIAASSAAFMVGWFPDWNVPIKVQTFGFDGTPLTDMMNVIADGTVLLYGSQHGFLMAHQVGPEPDESFLHTWNTQGALVNSVPLPAWAGGATEYGEGNLIAWATYAQLGSDDPMHKSVYTLASIDQSGDVTPNIDFFTTTETADPFVGGLTAVSTTVALARVHVEWDPGQMKREKLKVWTGDPGSGTIGTTIVDSIQGQGPHLTVRRLMSLNDKFALVWEETGNGKSQYLTTLNISGEILLPAPVLLTPEIVDLQPMGDGFGAVLFDPKTHVLSFAQLDSSGTTILEQRTLQEDVWLYPFGAPRIATVGQRAAITWVEEIGAETLSHLAFVNCE